MNIKYKIVLGFILFMLMVSASFLIFNQEKPSSDGRIWCYVETVEFIDGLELTSDQVVRYTLGGIDVFEKCK